MATNEILPFAQGVGANVQDQASYTAEPLRSSGNVAGIARSNVNNKALRQASVIAAGIAQFMADRQANNITDSATPANISAWMALAVQSLSSTDFLNTARIDVASAGTINLTTAAPDTRHINITGTTTINGFTVAAGQCYFVRFAGALTLTNSASLVTQTGENIATAAGDTCIIRATAANVVEVLVYTPAIPQALGYRQTWQNVTASRVAGTIYTNTTGRPVFVLINIFWSDSTDNVTLNVNGSPVVDTAEGGLHGWSSPISVIIPPGSTYNLTSTGSLLPIKRWMELR